VYPIRVHDSRMNGRPLCDLHFATGAKEECPGADCAFWEDEGCVFERVSFEFEGRPDVARWLLGIRRELEGARGVEPAGARGGLHAFLPPGLRD
jgi:hypothetical protein